MLILKVKKDHKGFFLKKANRVGGQKANQQKQGKGN